MQAQEQCQPGKLGRQTAAHSSACRARLNYTSSQRTQPAVTQNDGPWQRRVCDKRQRYSLVQRAASCSTFPSGSLTRNPDTKAAEPKPTAPARPCGPGPGTTMLSASPTCNRSAWTALTRPGQRQGRAMSPCNNEPKNRFHAATACKSRRHSCPWSSLCQRPPRWARPRWGELRHRGWSTASQNLRQPARGSLQLSCTACVCPGGTGVQGTATLQSHSGWLPARGGGGCVLFL